MGRLIRIVMLTVFLSGFSHGGQSGDHEKAYRLLEDDTILSLIEILRIVDLPQESRLLEVEMEQEDDRLVYEIEYVLPSGEIEELTIDPHTGEVLERERED